MSDPMAENPKLTDALAAYDVEKILEEANRSVPKAIQEWVYSDPESLGVPQMQQILSRLRYKPGWRMSLHPDAYSTLPRLVIEVRCEDSYNPGREIRVLHQYRLTPYIRDENLFVAFVRQCLERTEIHEMHEWLKWEDDPKPIFDPHAHEGVPPQRI